MTLLWAWLCGLSERMNAAMGRAEPVARGVHPQACRSGRPCWADLGERPRRRAGEARPYLRADRPALEGSGPKAVGAGSCWIHDVGWWRARNQLFAWRTLSKGRRRRPFVVGVVTDAVTDVATTSRTNLGGVVAESSEVVAESAELVANRA